MLQGPWPTWRWDPNLVIHPVCGLLVKGLQPPLNTFPCTLPQGCPACTFPLHSPRSLLLPAEANHLPFHCHKVAMVWRKPSVGFAEMKSILTTLMLHEKMTSILHNSNSKFFKVWNHGGLMLYPLCPWPVWLFWTILEHHLMRRFLLLLLLSSALLSFLSYPVCYPPFLSPLLPQASNLAKHNYNGNKC